MIVPLLLILSAEQRHGPNGLLVALLVMME